MFGCSGLALIALSCAGHRVDETAVPGASAGDEPPPRAANLEAAPGASPAKSERGHVVVTEASVAGKAVPAHARMENGDRPIDFELGEEISAEAGTRHISVSLADDSALVDKPTRQFDVFVHPGKATKLAAAFPWAKVQLNVIERGRSVPRAPVKLFRDGKLVAEVKSGPPAFLVSPGNYEAEVNVRGKALRVRGLAFFENSEQTVPVQP